MPSDRTESAWWRRAGSLVLRRARRGWYGLGRGWGRVERAFQSLARNALRVVGLIGLVVLLSLVGLKIYTDFETGNPTSASDLVPYAVGLLVTAGLVQIGPALSERVKKVGPVEFYAAEVRQVLPELKEILRRAPRLPKTSGPRVAVFDEPIRLHPEQAYFVEKAQALVDHLEFTGLRTNALGKSREVHALVSRVAGLDLDQGRHARAVDRLKLLLEISEESYEPAETWDRLATAQIFLGLALRRQTDAAPSTVADVEVDRRRGELYERAIRSARRAIVAFRKLGVEDVRPQFTVAYGHHLLGDTTSAIALYGEALEIDSRHAPSRYNLAMVLIDQSALDEAVTELEQLDISDRELKTIVESYREDPEIQPLLADPKRGPRALTKFEELESGLG